MKLIISIQLLLSVFLYGFAQAETIIWAQTSFPTAYITSGAEKGQGTADRLDRFMMEKLSQYDHKTVEYPNWERSLSSIKQGPVQCTSIMFYRSPDDREQTKGSYAISAPSGLFFLHSVVVRKDKRHLYGDEVSFKQLLENQNLRFGYNRPYGITYNRILADYLGIPKDVELDAMDPIERLRLLNQTKNISVRSSGNMIDGMLKMLLTNRVDYILEYDSMMKFLRKRMDFGDQLVSIPVTEGKNIISRLAYICSDTPQGNKAIQAINDVLKEHRNTKEFKDNLDYLVPTDREKQYWREYEKILSIYE